MAGSMTITAELTGFEGLVKALDNVKLGLRNKTLRRATTKACRVIAKKAKAKCPTRTKATAAKNVTPLKLLKKSITVKVWVRKKDGAVFGKVGPDVKKPRTQVGKRTRAGKLKDFGKPLRRLGGKKAQYATEVGDPIYEDPRKIAHLVEFGTRHAAARPFLRPALAESKGEVAAIFQTEIAAGLAADAKKG